MADEYETEGRRTRQEIAAYLGSLAGALDGDGEVRLAVGGDVVTVVPPAECDFEIEVEREEGRREVELEIEWDADDEPPGAGTESTEDHGTADAADHDASDVVEAEEPGAVPALGGGSRATFELFEDRADEWRWRLVHDNGNVIASSGEGYTRKANARKGLRSVKRNAPGAAETEE